METNVVAVVEMSVESPGRARPASEPSLRVRMLGPLSIDRGAGALALPASRKVRGLLAYLALSPLPVSRSHLCELLWEIPNDPRGELRWCLSKLRGVIDEEGRPRVQTSGASVRLDLAGCAVDAIEVGRAVDSGIAKLDAHALRRLAALFRGDFLEGLEIDRSPAFGGWVVAQRRRLRSARAALLERLVESVSEAESFDYLEEWLQLEPLEARVHQRFLAALARRGRVREGEEHLAATARAYAAEGLNFAPIRDAWVAARREHAGPSTAAPSSSNAAVESAREAKEPGGERRGSIAVMPFLDRPGAGMPAGAAEALTHDVITRLAQLRSLSVVPQAVVFALHERGIGSEEAGRMLNADYVVAGCLRRHGKRACLSVELTETRSARIVWAEAFSEESEDAFVRAGIVGERIVAALAAETEAAERNRAILQPADSLGAWEAHHRGLWHMYRFSPANNEQARHFFETAVRLDPTFARAYAGLSFTHFQNAFQGWTPREPEIERAFEAAEQSVMADERNPAAHWAMGRALWLRERHDECIDELERAVALSPDFALGHYALAFVHAQAGDPEAAIARADHARALSPFDPMLCAVLGVRALALARLGRFDEAADWGSKAAARPNAHAHIRAIAAYSLGLAGSGAKARAHAAAIRASRPHYGADDFLAAFRLPPKGEALFRKGARLAGMA